MAMDAVDHAAHGIVGEGQGVLAIEGQVAGAGELGHAMPTIIRAGAPIGILQRERRSMECRGSLGGL